MYEMELRRPRSALPDREGWWFGRWPISGFPKIVPVFVGTVMWEQPRGNTLMVMAGDLRYNLSDFQWFGPVPVCVESGT